MTRTTQIAGASPEAIARESTFTRRSELLFACAGLVLVSVLYREELVAFDPAKWATISAWGLLIIGIAIAQQLDGRFKQMLQRLSNRGAVSAPGPAFQGFLDTLFLRSKVAALVGGVLLPTILLVAYVIVYRGQTWDSMTAGNRILLLSEIALESTSALIVGRYVGRGVFFGFLGKQMSIEGVQINMIFGHSDNAAGLRPIGDFYFFQALVTALPVVFFAFWVLMMPVWSTIWPNADSDFAKQWKNTYLAFFFMALAVELVAFVMPLWFFHQEMQHQKLLLIPRADSLTAELSQLQRDRRDQLDARHDASEPAHLMEQIELIESLPTWPLAPDVRTRFAWGNLAFLAAPAAKMSQTVIDAFSVGIKG